MHYIINISGCSFSNTSKKIEIKTDIFNLFSQESRTFMGKKREEEMIFDFYATK